MGGPKEGYSATDWGIAVVIGVVFFFGLRSCRSGDDSPEAPAESRAVVSNSSWDASVKQVKEYLKKNAKDASSIEYLEWSSVRREPDGNFAVRVKYRAKNSFGAFVVENVLVRLDKNGNVLSVVQIE